MTAALHPAPACQPVASTRWRYADEAVLARDTEVAVEWPVNIRYGPLPYAVMMATPLDLEDFVSGFSLTEGVIERQDDIRGIRIVPEAEATTVEVTLAPARLRAHLGRRRSLAGRTSCGVCGVEDAAQLPRAAPARAMPVAIDAVSVAAGVAALRGWQPLHARTRSVHGAAWCDLTGRILLAREDVGRHNALDKLAGAVLRAGLAAADGFVVVTSRASYEMVEKTAILGAPALVSVSAPTSLAVTRARASGLTLVSVARDEGCEVFAGRLRG